MHGINSNISNVFKDGRTIRILVQTDTTTNISKLIDHQWIMNQCSKVIAEYIEYDSDSPFDCVYLKVAINT